MEYDVFISHASEDKVEVVDELVRHLNTQGVTTWYDTQVLKMGDSLQARINEGLATARYGVVILSPSFFSKQWPQEELDGLYARQTRGRDFRILPVWHHVTSDEVAQYSPMLAGKVAGLTSEGLQTVARKIRDAVKHIGPVANPSAYAHHHLGQTIRLLDLPLAYGVIESRLFENCHLTGPCVLALQGDNSFWNIGVPTPETFFPLPIGRSYAGMLVVRDCGFMNCRFDTTVGIAIPADNYDEVMRGFGQVDPHP